MHGVQLSTGVSTPGENYTRVSSSRSAVLARARHRGPARLAHYRQRVDIPKPAKMSPKPMRMLPQARSFMTGSVEPAM